MRIHYEPIKASSDKLLSRIKQYIQKLYDTAYGDKADFSDMSRVPILVNYDGHTDKVVSRVLLDLINYRIIYEENGKTKKVINKFANLPEMWEALQKMNTDTFQSMSVYSSTYTNANMRKYNNEVKSMRIYSNRKRPVKASNDGRKWVNTELNRADFEKLRKFLTKNGYKFEPSEAYNLIHVECYLNDAEIKKVNDFIDTLDSVESACGKKSVKSSTRRRSVKASYGGWGKFYGLDDVEFTVPNDMDDPTIFYNGKYYNYYDIEDTLWDYYKEDCEENGVIPDENDFENWVSTNSYLVYDLLDEISPKSKPGRGVVRSSTNRRKSVKASYTVEYFSFDELTPDQQTYVIEHWADMDKLYYLLVEWWNEDQMDQLQYDEEELASEYNQKYGLSINPDKIYWQSNSQGPYPEWDLSQVFDEYQLNDGTEIYFYGSGLDVETETDSWGEEVESPEIDEVVGHAQEFIDKVWSWIHGVCTSFPEKDWIFDMLDANAVGDFYIKSDGTVGYN